MRTKITKDRTKTEKLNDKDMQLTELSVELATVMEVAARRFLASAKLQDSDTATVVCAAMAIVTHELLLSWPDKQTAKDTAALIADMVRRLQDGTAAEEYGID